MKWGPEARKKITDLELRLARVEQERDEALATIDRMTSAAAFPHLDLDHGGTYALNALHEGEISLAKAAEWLRNYICQGISDPIVQGIPRSGGWDGPGYAELAAERDKLRHVAELCSLLAARMIAWRKGKSYCVPLAVNEAVEKLEGVF